MYVISVESPIFPYILGITFKTPQDALAMCEKLARVKGRAFVDGVLDNAVKDINTNKQARIFAFKPESVEKDYGFIIAEITTPVAKEPVAGRFIIDIDGKKIVKSTLSEVKAWLDGFAWANDELDENDWLAIELDLDKEFAIPTEDSKCWFLLDTLDVDGTVMSVEITWEAIHE